MLDDGMNDLKAVQVKFATPPLALALALALTFANRHPNPNQVKFAKFDEEKQVRERTQRERRQLREATRDAVRVAELRGRDLRFGRCSSTS